MEWYELIKQQGSRKRLAKRLGIDVSLISKIMNGTPISLELAIKIEVLSKGTLPAEALLRWRGKNEFAHLMKQLKWINQKQMLNSSELPVYLAKKPLLSIELCDADRARWHYFNDDKLTSRPLMIDEDHHLLFGFHRFQRLSKLNVHTVEVLFVPLLELLQEQHPLISPYPLTLLERLAIALALESKIETEKSTALFSCPNLDKIRRRKDSLIAQRCGIGSKSQYYKLKFILKHSAPELLQALNKNHLSIHRAYEWAQCPIEAQRAQLTDFLNLPLKEYTS